MVEPVTTTLTAGAIAVLVFQEAAKASAAELAKKFTTDAIAKLGELRTLIWNKVRGKHPKAEEALQKAETGDSQAIDTVATLLGYEMLDDAFAQQVQALAHQISAGKLQDNSSMTQNNYGNAKGWQTKVEGGTAYIGEINQYGSVPHPGQK